MCTILNQQAELFRKSLIKIVTLIHQSLDRSAKDTHSFWVSHWVCVHCIMHAKYAHIVYTYMHTAWHDFGCGLSPQGPSINYVVSGGRGGGVKIFRFYLVKRQLRGSRGSKIPDFETTYFMDGPLCIRLVTDFYEWKEDCSLSRTTANTARRPDLFYHTIYNIFF